MHIRYDVDKGVKTDDGMFSHRSIIALFAMLVAIGIWVGLCYMAPSIITPSAEDKRRIDQAATSEQPTADNWLRIPSAGIEAIVSQKNTLGTVYYTNKENFAEVTLMANHRTIGITPWETLAMSPLYRLDMVNEGDLIYLDFEGKRTIYKAVAVDSQIEIDLVIIAIINSNNKIQISAKKIGEVIVTDNQAEITEEDLNIPEDLDIGTE